MIEYVKRGSAERNADSPRWDRVAALAVVLAAVVAIAVFAPGYAGWALFLAFVSVMVIF